ncbi:hypothetical protein DPEC_G00363010 [Dallia pectoralis]|nr:hypothetical protein DPEC_G00363010 [Dallia pectoralis]
MNLCMGAKSKKRVVLPNRPDPPTVEQILEDISKASSNDPVFSVLEDENQDADKGSSDNDVETMYLQSRKYLEVNEQLQKIKGVREEHGLRPHPHECTGEPGRPVPPRQTAPSHQADASVATHPRIRFRELMGETFGSEHYQRVLKKNCCSLESSKHQYTEPKTVSFGHVRPPENRLS